MVYRGLDALTQIVSSSNSSFVKYVGYWQQNTTEDSFDIAHPSSPASVAFTFNGTQAGVFGIVSLNGYPLLGSIAGASGSSVNVAEKQPYSGYHSDHHSEQDWDPFYVTNTLPCDQYTLNLTVGHEQVMQVHQFKFAPCLPVSGNLTSASVSAPLSAVSADSISNIGSSSISSSTSTPSMLAAASRTGAGKPLSAALIATLALSSLLVFFALVGGLVLLLRLRRQRQRKRQRSRSHSQTHSRSRFRFRSLFRPRTWLRLPGHRPKLSPSAQYLASVVDTGSGGGGGDAGLLGPPVAWRNLGRCLHPRPHLGRLCWYRSR
ncbi:hypothetical protein BJV78DRAFT_341612 [Lactifluus subvellereus]|nr:hypothetical protein BJV78DRAFT_341612 [Lactifluus subvellereus]